MSRLEEIKNEVAKSKNFKSWNEMDYKGYIWDSDVESVAKQYAKECVKVSLLKASENAKMKTKDNIHELSMMDDWSELDKESITNTDNIVLI